MKLHIFLGKCEKEKRNGGNHGWETMQDSRTLARIPGEHVSVSGGGGVLVVLMGLSTRGRGRGGCRGGGRRRRKRWRNE